MATRVSLEQSPSSKSAQSRAEISKPRSKQQESWPMRGPLLVFCVCMIKTRRRNHRKPAGKD
eukprot:1122822-Amorphochlora_amoeboformis.AAC.1